MFPLTVSTTPAYYPPPQSYVSASEIVRGENKMTQNVQLTGGDVRGLTVIVATPEAAQPPCPSFDTVRGELLMLSCQRRGHREGVEMRSYFPLGCQTENRTF